MGRCTQGGMEGRTGTEGFLKPVEAPQCSGVASLIRLLLKTGCLPSPPSDFLLLRLLSGQESVTCLVRCADARGEGL